jgi:hypothetical protein
MSRSRRTIPEELLLLALDPATGTTAQPQSLDLGLAGAQLVELALAGRIAPDGDRIAVILARPTGDPTLDSALELLRRRGSPVRAVHWIGGPRLGLRQTYLTHLERCGMVHAVENHMCGVPVRIAVSRRTLICLLTALSDAWYRVVGNTPHIWFSTACTMPQRSRCVRYV